MSTAPLDEAKYVSLATFRKNGARVAVPVWLAGSAGRYLVMTEADSGKVKRLRGDPRIEVAACDMRGRVRPGARIHTGKARILEGDDASEAVEAVSRRYGTTAKLIGGLYRLRDAIKRKPRAERVGLELTIDDPDSP